MKGSMNKTVAIIGSHPGTRHDFDYERADVDVWVFNEAMKEDWVKRADGVFQIHKPVIWRSATNRNDPNHYSWLKSGDTPIIFMQDKYEDVPKSEKYPMDEIIQAFPEAQKYFTSSVAYAIALAIYKQYERIEIYGVEMATNTEYGHQRVGVAYWCGFGAGKGIDVDFHGTIFDAPLYGYDGDVQIPIEHYEKRITATDPHIAGTSEAYNNVIGLIDKQLDEFIKTYKADLSDLDAKIMAAGQNAQNFGMVNAARQVNEHYLEKCKQMLDETGTYLIVRQEFESHAIKSGKMGQEAQKKLMPISMELDRRLKALNTNAERARRKVLVTELKDAINRYTMITTDIGRAIGILKENRLLVHEFDTYLMNAGITPEPSTVEIPVEVES